MADIEWQNSLNWYLSKFPESQFLVLEANKEEHREKTILGHGIASRSNVLICGIMRNIGATMPYTIARIEALGKLFKDYHVFMYENDSTDNTKLELQQWHDTNPKISIEMEDVKPPKFHDLKGLDRRIWMAYARNKYLKWARTYAQQQRIDYLIIVDTDLQGGWSYHGVLNSLGHNDWDVMGANSIYYLHEDNKIMRLFYDAWALRNDGDPKEIPDTTANLFKFDRGEPLVKVNSCFGGLGIYKPYVLFDGVDYNDTDCDHPTLHNALCEKGYNIYLNPSQITLYNKTEYTL